MIPMEFSGHKTAFTENTTLAKAAPGLLWYLVLFEGARMKSGMFPRAERPPTTVTGSGVDGQKYAGGHFVCLCSSAPGRAPFRKMAACFHFYDKLPNLG